MVACNTGSRKYLLSGCAHASVSSKISSDNAVVEEEIEKLSVSESESIQMFEEIIYEYETQEFYAQCDENHIRIRGLLF